MLYTPRFNIPFLLFTDASDCGVGAVLSQLDDNGDDHPMAFYSRELLPRECHFSAVEKECLAIIYAVNHFKVYLLGTTF